MHNNTTITNKQLLLVARSWSNRGLNTDFRHFFNFFPGSINITNPKILHWDNRIYRWIKNQAKHNGYSSLSVALEVEVFKKAIFHRPKIIHFWFADHDYHYASYISKIIGAKLIGNFFFSIEEFERRMPNKNHLKSLDLITVSGKKQMEYLSQFVPREKLVYLPLGIDTEYFKPSESNLSNNNSSKIILHVGNNRRDYATLKKIFIKLQHLMPGIKIELVGCKNVEKIFIDIDNLTIHPFLSDAELLHLYQKASLLILPLLEGGSSQSMNEAMATGLPIVTNDLPNLRDYVDIDNVFMSPLGDVDSMTNHCYNLLSNSDLWERVSKKIRLNSLKYDYKNIRKKIIDIYKYQFNIEII